MSSDVKGNALVVDDQGNWRRALKILLQREGLNVSVAGSFKEAENILKSGSDFDLAVLDVRLVDEEIFNVGGLGLLYYIKSNYPQMKTIVITGYPDSIEDKIEKEKFILKVPKGTAFSTRDFTDRVREILKLKRHAENGI